MLLKKTGLIASIFLLLGTSATALANEQANTEENQPEVVTTVAQASEGEERPHREGRPERPGMRGPKGKGKALTIRGSALAYFGQFDPGVEGKEARYVNRSEASLSLIFNKGDLSGLYRLTQTNYDDGADQGRIYLKYTKDKLGVQIGYNEAHKMYISRSGTWTTGLWEIITENTNFGPVRYGAQFSGGKVFGDGMNITYEVADGIQLNAMFLTEERINKRGSGNTQQYGVTGKTGPIEFKLSRANSSYDKYDGTTDPIPANSTLLAGRYTISEGLSVSLDFGKKETDEGDDKDEEQNIAFQLKAPAGPGNVVFSVANNVEKKNTEDYSKTNYLSLVYNIPVERMTGIRLIAQNKKIDYESDSKDDETSTFYGVGFYTRFGLR